MKNRTKFEVYKNKHISTVGKMKPSWSEVPRSSS